MKNYLIIILVSIAAISCNQKQCNDETKDQKPTRETLQLDTICDGRIYESECIKRVETHIIKELSDMVSRDGKTLSLSIENADDISFTSNDNPMPEDYVDYRLTNYFPSINAYMISISLYEGRANKIINRKSGNTIETDGEILVSPDKNLFLSYNRDLATTYTFNGIEIYSVNEDKFQLEFRKKLDWGPEDPKWLSDTKIEFTKISPMDFKPAGKAVFTLVDGEWTEE